MEGTAAAAQENATQALTTANTARDTANAIAGTAEQAAQDAASALSTASAAETTANAIAGTAQQAQTDAAAALNAANSANATATTASQTANAIAGTAQQAQTDAAAALTTANAAASDASDAADAATAAQTTADTALTRANRTIEIASGGTGATTAAQARRNLGLAYDTNGHTLIVREATTGTISANAYESKLESLTLTAPTGYVVAAVTNLRSNGAFIPSYCATGVNSYSGQSSPTITVAAVNPFGNSASFSVSVCYICVPSAVLAHAEL